MHFNLTITIGDILSTLILGGLVHILSFMRRMELLIYQHELMWRDYKATHGIDDLKRQKTAKAGI